MQGGSDHPALPGGCQNPQIKSIVCARHGQAVHTIAETLRSTSCNGAFMLENAEGHAGRYELPAWLVPLDDRNTPLLPLRANGSRCPTRPDIIAIPTMREGSRIRWHSDHETHIYKVKFTHETLFADTIGAASLQQGALATCLGQRDWTVVYHILVIGSMGALPMLTFNTLWAYFQAGNGGAVREADKSTDKVRMICMT